MRCSTQLEMTTQKKKRTEDADLRKTVSKLPCMACPPPTREELAWILENLDQAPRISDPHHVTSRGAGGGDTAENLMPLCRSHHNEWEDPWKGPGYVVRKYARVRDWLELAGRTDVFERLGMAAPVSDGSAIQTEREDHDQEKFESSQGLHPEDGPKGDAQTGIYFEFQKTEEGEACLAAEQEGSLFEKLIKVTAESAGSLMLQYTDAEDCMEVEWIETGVVPENRVYLKRCYDLQLALDEIEKKR
jgi:hypothetical protein